MYNDKMNWEDYMKKVAKKTQIHNRLADYNKANHLKYYSALYFF